MTALPTFIHALSPLHAGVGQGSGVIDLPIAREKATGIPYLPGSSLKGALSTRSKSVNNPDITSKLFGREEDGGSDGSAGQVQFSDQRLLLLPVRSLAGTFAWVTSPYILSRLLRDSSNLQSVKQTITVPEPEVEGCFITDTSALTFDTTKDKIYIEDLDLPAKANPDAVLWAHWLEERIFPKQDNWKKTFTARFCIVHDDIFSFLLTTATEITARIRLQEDSKTVVQGGLWYEEALPTESILYGVMLASPHRNSSFNVDRIRNEIRKLTTEPIQLGGKATVGHGLCRVLIDKEGN
jgi:CRISPR type III-B/RAMP module RAMP protein Cmr4